MSHTIVSCPDITVANGANDSTVVKAKDVYDDAELIALMFGTNSTAGVIQVTDDPDAAVPTFYNLQSGGADIPTPAAAKAMTFVPCTKGFRVHFTAASVGISTIKMQKHLHLSYS